MLHDEVRVQNCLPLVFGQPRTAVFAQLDSIGFTVRYGRGLVPISGPEGRAGDRLVGRDAQGEINCTLTVETDAEEETERLGYEFSRDIARGTSLTYAGDFRETDTTVQSCYLDNRLGVWAALRLAETLEHGIIAFSCHALGLVFHGPARRQRAHARRNTWISATSTVCCASTRRCCARCSPPRAGGAQAPAGR